MTSMNKIVALDIENAFVTVEAGMTWSAYLKPYTPRTQNTFLGLTVRALRHHRRRHVTKRGVLG